MVPRRPRERQTRTIREDIVTRRHATAVLLALVLSAGAAWAHEGHNTKIMGTVAALQDNHLRVKTADGKTVMVMLTDKTSILRGKQKVKLTELKTGEHVVVEAADEKGMMTAHSVTLSAVTQTATK